VHRLKIWFSNNPDVSPAGVDTSAMTGAASVVKIMDILRDIQTVSNLRPLDRIIIYIGAVMTDALLTAKEIEKNCAVLMAMAKSVDTQRHVIAAFEWFCGSHQKALSSKFPLVLKSLFDEEIVDEEVFFSWSADYAKNDYSADDSLIGIDALEDLKSSSQPFITWLREAGEEGESSEEESGED
jgi:translation initiation factor 5